MNDRQRYGAALFRAAIAYLAIVPLAVFLVKYDLIPLRVSGRLLPTALGAATAAVTIEALACILLPQLAFSVFWDQPHDSRSRVWVFRFSNSGAHWRTRNIAVCRHYEHVVLSEAEALLFQQYRQVLRYAHDDNSAITTTAKVSARSRASHPH